MRGAALKLGQMISIQGSLLFPAEILHSFSTRHNDPLSLKLVKIDNKSISPQIREILERVRLSADYMPQKQREVRPLFSFHKIHPVTSFM